MLALGDKLGPMLWQLPPNLGFDAERLERLLRAAAPDHGREAANWPSGTTSASTAGRGLDTDADRPMRHALEVRHATFETPAFVELLRAPRRRAGRRRHRRQVAVIEDVTSDFVYVRLHGDEELYVSGYDDASLDRWAAKSAAGGRRRA